MSLRRRDSQYLADILEASRRILLYTEGLTYDEFVEQTLIQDAVLRNLQVLGEATKRLSETVRAGHREIAWREIAGMRDRVVHDYFGTDLRIVWEVVRHDLPPLLARVRTILAQEID